MVHEFYPSSSAMYMRKDLLSHGYNVWQFHRMQVCDLAIYEVCENHRRAGLIPTETKAWVISSHPPKA